MDSIYLISLIVGGFFVLLSIFGGADNETDHDVHVELDVDTDTEWEAGHELDVDAGHDLGVVDLLSIRALFLFSAFFGLTGISLTALSMSEPLTGVLSAGTGLLVGIGGNYIIKKFAYEEVSSLVTQADLSGRTARVLLPFSAKDNGKILIEVGEKRIRVTARLFGDSPTDIVQKDEEVVVVNMDGRIAEVLRPD